MTVVVPFVADHDATFLRATKAHRSTRVASLAARLGDDVEPRVMSAIPGRPVKIMGERPQTTRRRLP
jgi:hypothetical protein